MLPQSEWLSSKKQTRNISEDVEEKKPLYTIGGNVNLHSCYGDQYGGASKN
jgi:hypothetical protein